MVNRFIRELKIISLASGEKFNKTLCHHLLKIRKKQPSDKKAFLTKFEEVYFANREMKVVINESVRDKDLYIVQLFDDNHSNHSKNSINDNIMALACAVNAAFYSEAYRITAVIPQYPYARQDKKKGREPITAKLVGNLLELSGCNRIITLDIHSESIEGFFSKLVVENLHMGRVLIKYIENNLDLTDLMVISPDVGSAKRGLFFAKKLKVELAIINKVRDYSKSSTIAKMELVGNVKNKNVLICDDMIATGGTVISALELLQEKGAKDVYIAVAFPYFSNGFRQFELAYEKKLFKKIIGTNAVNLPEEIRTCPWYDELDVSHLFAQVIHNLNCGESVSKLLN